MLPGPYMGDYLNTLMIAASTLSALYRAEKTGKGESIDLAMYETLLSIGQYYLVDYLNARHQVASSWRTKPEPLRHRRVPVQGRLPGRMPLRRRQNKHFLETIGLGHLWGTRIFPRIPPVCGSPILMLMRSRRHLRTTASSTPSMRSKKTSAAHRIAAQVVSRHGGPG